jgi:hypothetical protein
MKCSKFQENRTIIVSWQKCSGNDIGTANLAGVYLDAGFAGDVLRYIVLNVQQALGTDILGRNSQSLSLDAAKTLPMSVMFTVEAAHSARALIFMRF